MEDAVIVVTNNGLAESDEKLQLTLIAKYFDLLLQNDNGIRALSLVCTDLGYTVKERNLGFECPCHRSRFDRSGMVLKGLAKANLRKLRVEEAEDGNLHVFTA